MKNRKRYIKKIEIIDDRSLPKNKAARLRKLRGLANLTRKDMTIDSGITLYSLRGWETGRFGGLPLDGAKKVIKRITKEGVECSLEWLLHGVGAAPRGTILERHQCEQNDGSDDEEKTNTKGLFENEELLIAEELAFFRKQFKKTLDFKVNDDGLAPFYKPGEYVAGIEQPKQDFTALIGLNCIVITKENKTYLRKLTLGTKKNTFTLECTNPASSAINPTLYNVKILKAAPIIRHYKLKNGSL